MTGVRHGDRLGGQLGAATSAPAACPVSAGSSQASALTSATTGGERARPAGRGAVSKPGQARWQNRRRHLRTVSSQTPSRPAIARSVRRPRASSTIRARSTSGDTALAAAGRRASSRCPQRRHHELMAGRHGGHDSSKFTTVRGRSQVTTRRGAGTPVGHDGAHGQAPGLHQDLAAPTADRPRPRTLAPAQPTCRALPRRSPTSTATSPTAEAAAVPAALRRLRQHLGLRDLPGQPRRLRGLHPAHRLPRRQPAKTPSTPPAASTSTTPPPGSTPDELTGVTTRPGAVVGLVGHHHLRMRETPPRQFLYRTPAFHRDSHLRVSRRPRARSDGSGPRDRSRPA